MSLIRVLRTASAVLTRTFYVDETPTDMAAPPTVTVTRLDGTAVTSGTAVHATTGVYTFTLPGGPAAPASATWQVDHLRVVWSGTLAGAVVSMEDRVEVVGGFLFGLAEARASDPSLSDPVRYPTAALAERRIEVEQECERICGRAFVPRFARRTLDGSGRAALPLPDSDIRVVRAVTTQVRPAAAVVVPDVSVVAVDGASVLIRWDRGVWPFGASNIVVEFEFGMDAPPEDLKEAAMYRLRSRLNLTRSGVPDRVSSYTTPEGSVYRVTLPGRYSTGIPDVDAVYAAYRTPVPGFA